MAADDALAAKKCQNCKSEVYSSLLSVALTSASSSSDRRNKNCQREGGGCLGFGIDVYVCI